MESPSKETTTHATSRHYARVMAFVVGGVLLTTLLIYFIPASIVVFAPEGTSAPEESEVRVATSSFARSEPVRLVIPKINLDTTFVPPLTLNADQTVSVPDSYEEVGWYTYGATPGEIGPAVILGHVDSLEGPAVFFSLGQLDAGDEIEVTRADGTVATFIVTNKERLPQEKFPTEKVYGQIDYAGLRLVTCTGIYNKGSLRYSHNLIVYAELKADSNQKSEEKTEE